MSASSRTLYIIPARGGSRGIPGKNIRMFNGKALIHHSIEYARLFAADNDIYVSTDSDEIASVAGKAGLPVPFMRPAHLAGDDAGMHGVLKHALNTFAENNDIFDKVVLLQPTSPLRLKSHLTEALSLFNDGIDMVVSVCEAKGNPYFSLFEENVSGYLEICKQSDGVLTRQGAPPVYCYNGSIYIINAFSLLHSSSLSSLKRVKKYLMEKHYSVDIDDETDWLIADCLYKKYFS